MAACGPRLTQVQQATPFRWGSSARCLANTLPDHVLMPEPSAHLFLYSGHQIPCVGSLTLGVRRKRYQQYGEQKFFVINVSGPAIVGLPTCELLGLVELNLDAIAQRQAMVHNQPDLTKTTTNWQLAHLLPPAGTQINSVEDLKQWFPDCFDGIGCFTGTEQLYVKPDAKPFVNAPTGLALVNPHS